MPRRLLLPLLFLFLALPGLAMAADERVLPQSREQVRLSFAPVVHRTAPAVVNVFSKRSVRTAGSPFANDPFFRHFFGEDSPFAAPMQRVQQSLGSGVIVAPDGTIITNHHVIKDADQVTIVLADRREFEARILRVDERADLAVLKVDAIGEKLPYLEIGDSDALQVGDFVLAIGDPFGVGQTVTSGIISALARTHVGVSDYRSFIQTDAAINPGNSGGALVDVDGRLVGINTAIYSQSGGSIGIGFAIPATMVRSVLAGAGKGGKLVRPWLGATGQPVTPEIAQGLGLQRPVGVLLNNIAPDSPAAQAGLKIGDVIRAIDGHEIDDGDDLRFRIATLPVGQTARLEIWRSGENRAVSLPLSAPPEDPPRQTFLITGSNPLAGISVANLSPALGDEIGIDTAARGVVVTDVARGSPALRFGMRVGDLVIALNEFQVTEVRDVKEWAATVHRPWRIAIKRGDKVLNMTVGG